MTYLTHVRGNRDAGPGRFIGCMAMMRRAGEVPGRPLARLGCADARAGRPVACPGRGRRG
ncbi:hypothetical protein GCM10010106_08550 [Thermopolyspora flexuosa]|nr:hypothetical protein GCM10010106_08550 [Thermopolyspora flexuosa]